MPPLRVDDAADVRISTGATDWSGTSSYIDPNFGDYADNATDGTTPTSPGPTAGLRVPQPFVDSADRLSRTTLVTRTEQP